MKKVVSKILFLVVLFPQFHTAQDLEGFNQKFDSIYFDTAVNVSGRDVNQAIKIADSLYQHSISDIHKVRSLMLTSTLYQRKSENEEAIKYAMLAGKIADDAKIYEWQARISGFLSTQYRRIGLYNNGRVYLEKGITASRHISDENTKNLYLGMVYQESAYYDLQDKDFLKAESHVKLADGYFDKLPEGVNKDYFLATNEELSGRIYVNLKQYDKAFDSYNKAIYLLEGIAEKDASLNGFIYSGLGQVYFNKEDYENAYKYLAKAEKIAENSDFISLKLEVYKTLSEYYKVIDDYPAYSLYNKKFIEAFKLNEANKSESIRSFIDSIEMKNQSLLKNRNVLIAISSSLLLIFIITAIIYKRKKKKEFERFRSLIADLKQKDTLPVPEKTTGAPKKKEKKQFMSPDVEEKIVEGLQEFEKSKQFADKEISLSVLAGLLKTNTKYLSYVLNKHKGKDFNSYINNLRIKYIVNKIETDDAYKKYKISYLAEESGFSSHSKFSAVFKSLTGFTPSVFLGYIEKSKKEPQ